MYNYEVWYITGKNEHGFNKTEKINIISEDDNDMKKKFSEKMKDKEIHNFFKLEEKPKKLTSEKTKKEKK